MENLSANFIRRSRSMNANSRRSSGSSARLGGASCKRDIPFERFQDFDAGFVVDGVNGGGRYYEISFT